MLNQLIPASYQPDQVMLSRYADVLVNFALGNKYGIKPGEVVHITVPDVAKSLAKELHLATLKAGGHPMIHLLPTGFDKDFYTQASDQQLAFFPESFFKERANLIDHSIYIIADPDPFELSHVEPSKIITARDARRQYREWLVAKENNRKFTWTIALWGVQAKADIVGLSLEEYWQQIISACFLDSDDPVGKWKQLKKNQEATRKKINSLTIESLNITGPDVNITIQIGADRVWKGGADRNIPSFELFTSPNWRGVEGWIRFNQPVYRYGSIIQDVELEIRQGVIVSARARKGQQLLTQMLKSKDADKIGEFSLTDKRLSRISHVMAETLYDENIGGPFGNMHLAIGMAYKDCYRGDASKPTKQEWQAMGFNDSAEHTDIISTTDRTVVATLANGNKITIYSDGMFVL